MWWIRGCLATVLMMGLVACAPTLAETPTPVPVTYQCTPEVGGAPYACTEVQHREMLTRNALYAEAEQIYRDFYEIDMKSYKAGQPASAEALALTVGEGADIVREAHVEGTQFTGEPVGIVWIHRAAHASRAGSILALEACLDNSAASVHTKGSESGPGAIAQERAFFSQTPEGLRISYFEFHEVESC